MPDIYLDDTIAALATPVGEGGIAVLRMSGPGSFEILRRIFNPSNRERFEAFESHTIHYGSIIQNDRLFDQVLVGLFINPHSYTGEDLVEISCHGGLVVTRRILALIIEEGARPAQPGEFTRRAFLNGKIDLAQAEAVLDLIRAKSERSLEIAIRQLAGTLSKKFSGIKTEMMKVYAHMEAFLDFPEEDLEIFEDQTFMAQFDKLGRELEVLIQSFRRGALLREGVKVVLVGRPNTGKSSLFNALLARDRALVSNIPGTTRDHLEEALEIEGIYIRLIDTAGLGLASSGPLEELGMKQTEKILQTGNLFLFLLDGSESITAMDEKIFRQLPEGRPVIVLVNKSDLKQKIQTAELHRLAGQRTILEISSKLRRGLDELERNISAHCQANIEEGEQITRLRHKQSLEQALQFWKRAEVSFKNKESLEIVILDVKAAIDALRELIGEIYSEDLLDVIFAEFCIGK